jgi:hypothetical protein
MENILRSFLADQLFGLDGLINFANIAPLLAFSVRDVLKLRILALASDVMTVRLLWADQSLSCPNRL